MFLICSSRHAPWIEACRSPVTTFVRARRPAWPTRVISSPRRASAPAPPRPARRAPVEADVLPLNATSAPESAYTAASIEVLEGLEPVRRRPGMYIGGTDEPAMHHLFAEVLDNAMDEAIAGHATFIDVLLDAAGAVTVTDNGRGMPVEPHPKFPGKSTVEVIMTVLHAGGKFDSGAYQTSGGLHGVGVSVCNALSETLEVEVARGQTLHRQTFSRGGADVGARHARQGAEPARHQGALQARSADLRRGRRLQARPPVQDGAGEGLPVRRRRDPLAQHRARRRRRAPRGGLPFPRRPEGLAGAGHRRQDARRRSGLHRQGDAPGRPRLAGMGAVLAGRR